MSSFLSKIWLCSMKNTTKEGKEVIKAAAHSEPDTFKMQQLINSPKYPVSEVLLSSLFSKILPPSLWPRICHLYPPPLCQTHHSSPRSHLDQPPHHISSPVLTRPGDQSVERTGAFAGRVHSRQRRALCRCRLLPPEARRAPPQRKEDTRAWACGR